MIELVLRPPRDSQRLNYSDIENISKNASKASNRIPEKKKTTKKTEAAAKTDVEVVIKQLSASQLANYKRVSASTEKYSADEFPVAKKAKITRGGKATPKSAAKTKNFASAKKTTTRGKKVVDTVSIGAVGTRKSARTTTVVVEKSRAKEPSSSVSPEKTRKVTKSPVAMKSVAKVAAILEYEGELSAAPSSSTDAELDAPKRKSKRGVSKKARESLSLFQEYLTFSEDEGKEGSPDLLKTPPRQARTPRPIPQTEVKRNPSRSSRRLSF